MNAHATASISASSSVPNVLTTDQLFQTVEHLAPRVAVFDCDGTLWSGDAGSSFMHWTMQNGLLSPEKVDWMRERYAAYKQGEVSELVICGEMVQVYAGLTEASLREAAAIFFREHVEPHLFPELQRLVASLQQRGTEIWTVSSTNDWVIEEGVTRFGIPADHVLAARVQARDGVVTERLLDVPTDEGKVTALRRAGVTAPDAVFGNSVHDAAMLAMARTAFPINPTPALQQRSAVENWAIYWPEAIKPA